MNRGEFILSTVNDALGAEQSFDVLPKWSDNIKSEPYRVKVYVWILDDAAEIFDEYEDGTALEPVNRTVRLGVKYLFSSEVDRSRARQTELYNETIAKMEYAISQCSLPVTSDDDTYNSRTKILAIRPTANLGYYDDSATSAETSSVLTVYCITSPIV